MTRLRRSDCSGPGIRRRGRGRGFEYLDEGGQRIEDPETLERLAELRIPPAWKDVWICTDPMGHLQATGIDDAGRKQYLYHEHWRLRRDQQKFDEMLGFAAALPRLRRRVTDDLADADAGLSRDRVLACGVRLLDRGCFRVGHEDYAEQNETYGLATMHRRHVHVDADEIHFDYPAKGGQQRRQVVRDREAAEVVALLRRRRSRDPELLAYRNGRRWYDLRSEDLNAYIKGAAGDEFSAKDFRTWNATVLMAAALADGSTPASKTARRRKLNDALKRVAGYLGNTPAVCRQSYVDPRVIDRFHDGETIAASLRRVGVPGDAYDPRIHRSIERAVIRLIEG